MSLLRDPTIKLFGKTIPLSPPKLAAGVLEVYVAGRVQFEVCDDESSKEVEEIGYCDEKKHVEDHQGESSLKGLRDGSGSSGIIDLDAEGSSNERLKNGDQSGDTSGVVDGKTLKRPNKIIPCSRCNSMETKFCYYNNYNVNQPRHFCKKCQRYWTAGGSMRNVPVGSGRRKSKSSSGSFCRQVLVNEASMQANQYCETNGVLRFGSDAPLCDSMANTLNLADNRENYCQNGSEYQVADKRIHMGEGCDVGLNKQDISMMGKGTESQDAMKVCQGYSLQVPFYPGTQWASPWNPAMAPPQMGLSGYPAACYSMQNYWPSGMISSWVHPSLISSTSNVPAQNSPTSSPNSPILGKHSRNGTIMNAANSNEKVAPSEPKASRGIWVPKTLRIDDPSQAAKSSIWETLGIQNEKSSINEGGIFHGNNKLPERPRLLHTNPAALSRSQNFHETTSMKQTST